MSVDDPGPVPTARAWIRPMVPRSPDEPHRASTPLELFFDLCFVVAVAQAAGRLHHDLAEGHTGHAVLSYLMVFFAIWWAWMNFSWFASAYDTDDDLYRLTTFVQIVGALVLAAGVGPAFDRADFAVVTVGYVIMRVALVFQWLRAARGDPRRRTTTLRYAVGVTLVQAGWLARLALPPGWGLASFLVLAVADVAVPVWAERPDRTRFHPHHIAERYGLFTLIVLGESVLAATVAVQSGLGGGGDVPALLLVAGCGLVIVFGMWWLYFDRPAYGLLSSLRSSLIWGYGHYLVFAATAAVGAGLAVTVDHSTAHAHLSTRAAGFALAVPVAVFLLSLRLLHLRPHPRARFGPACTVAAVLVLLAPFTAVSTPVIAAVIVGLVTSSMVIGARATGLDKNS